MFVALIRCQSFVWQARIKRGHGKSGLNYQRHILTSLLPSVLSTGFFIPTLMKCNTCYLVYCVSSRSKISFWPSILITCTSEWHWKLRSVWCMNWLSASLYFKYLIFRLSCELFISKQISTLFEACILCQWHLVLYLRLVQITCRWCLWSGFYSQELSSKNECTFGGCRSGSVCLDVINQTWSPMFGEGFFYSWLTNSLIIGCNGLTSGIHWILTSKVCLSVNCHLFSCLLQWIELLDILLELH